MTGTCHSIFVSSTPGFPSAFYFLQELHDDTEFNTCKFHSVDIVHSVVWKESILGSWKLVLGNIREFHTIHYTLFCQYTSHANKIMLRYWEVSEANNFL